MLPKKEVQCLPSIIKINGPIAEIIVPNRLHFVEKDAVELRDRAYRPIRINNLNPPGGLVVPERRNLLVLTLHDGIDPIIDLLPVRSVVADEERHRAALSSERAIEGSRSVLLFQLHTTVLFGRINPQLQAERLLRSRMRNCLPFLQVVLPSPKPVQGISENWLRQQRSVGQRLVNKTNLFTRPIQSDDLSEFP